MLTSLLMDRKNRQRLSQVLVGTDFSTPARLALARALQLASYSQAAVDLVHVLKHRRLLTNKDEALARKELQAFVSAVVKKEKPKRLSSRVVSTDGKPADVLRAEAAEVQAQLVVMGRTGGNFLRGLVLGSTAEKLARTDERALVVVHPDGSSGKPYKRPLVAVDFSDEADRAVELVAALAPEAKSVDVLHVYDRSYALVLRATATGVDRVAQYDEQQREGAERHMQEFLAAHRALRPHLKLVPCVVGGDPRPDIRDQALRLKSDLLVLGRRGESGNTPIGTTVEGLLRIAPCDLALTGRPTFTA